MNTLKFKNNISIKKIKVRASTLVFPFGTGAMIDLPDWVLMTTSCKYWDEKKLTTIHDERLEKILNVKGFKSPVIKDSNIDNDEEENKQLYIPFVKFPTWYFCPKCRTFKPLKEWENDYVKKNDKDMTTRPTCSKCGVKLAPARLVIACENGHIDDFPWVEWTHLKSNKKICSNPKLKIKTSGVSSGLEGISVECDTCKARVSLSGTFTNGDKNEFETLESYAEKKDLTIGLENFSLKCKGNRPWDGTKNEKCGLYPSTVQRGAINVYFPKIETSIVIPPYSDIYTKKVEQSLGYQQMNGSLEDFDKLSLSEEIKNSAKQDIINNKIKDISEEIDLSEEVVRKIIVRKLETVEEKEISTDKMKYKEDEYKALVGDLSYDILDQADFKIEPKNANEYNRKYLNKVILINKLREVRALIGFSRINAPDNNIIDIEDESDVSNKNYKLIKPLSDKNWYPAIDVNGEGIFIELNEKLIEQWEDEIPEVSSRIKNLNRRYCKILSDKDFSIRKITPKFVLLHTLAHLIIKELSFKCGYSSTALRERIYCNTEENDYHMCGIMIYTANGDAEGTLGGLVRQGKSDRLSTIIDNAIEKARFCSSDPVCIESLGQGRDSLNLAACFSCCLVSETSCEEFNTLLDRALVVGTLDNENVGFFNYIKR